MAKTATIRARAEPDLNVEAGAALPDLGLAPTLATTLFHREIVREPGIPFSLRLPATAPARNG